MSSEPEGLGSALKLKPIKTLPTERVGFDTQLAILRAYAAASGPERKPVSNAEVSSIASLSASSISLCNPFWNDVGLLFQEGRKQKPADVVFDYASAHNWDAAAAPKKLAPILKNTWFANALLPALGFRPLAISEGITRLADSAKAPPKYKLNLRLLIDYLNAAQLLILENDTLKKASTEVPPAVNPDASPVVETQRKDKEERHPQDPEFGEDMEHFSIPIPGKRPAMIAVPKNLDHADWQMLETMIKTYIERLQRMRGLIGQDKKEARHEKSEPL